MEQLPRGRRERKGLLILAPALCVVTHIFSQFMIPVCIPTQERGNEEILSDMKKQKSYFLCVLCDLSG